MSTFPQPFLSSISHWQATNRGPTSLYNHNSEKSLPKETDILIVGGGTMGASLSYFLTHDGYTESTNDTHKSTNRPRITLLEAKDIASGASGRNGGHVGPATFSAWTTLQQPIPFGAGLSEEEATRVIHAERENLDLIEEVVKREGLEGKVDWWRGDLCEVHHSPTSPSALLSSYQSWLNSRSIHLNLPPSTSNTSLITDPHQASAIARMDKAIAVQLRPAGSVHSHKLCTELMRCAMEVRDGKGVELFSWTVVESMDPIDQSSSALDQDVSRQRGEGEGEAKDAEAYKWRVKTNKGMIKAKKVVLCTNAHTQNFFEEGDPLHDHIAPTFTQCSLITPPSTFSGDKALRYTYNMEKGGYYMIQTGMGGMVLGGGETDLVKKHGNKFKPGFNIFQKDDSFVIDEWAKIQAAYCPSNFKNWGPEAHGEGLTRVWSGILTRVKDKLPLVGEIPGRDGMWIAAGFHGHGQSRIFSVARALASQLQSPAPQKWNSTLLPRSFQISTERLDRCKGIQHPAGDDSDLNSVERQKRGLGEMLAGEFVRGPRKGGAAAEKEEEMRMEDRHVERRTLPMLMEKVELNEKSELQPESGMARDQKSLFRCNVQ